MNKIIITGHPDSGYARIEDLLLRSGMKAPMPSRTNCLMPGDIYEELRKTYPVPETHTLTKEHEFLPVDVSPSHHEMALDLFISNKDRGVWGWADSETIFFLEYWRQLDTDSLFVLAYDEPVSVLQGSFSDITTLKDTDALIRWRIDNWAAYNGAMLRFYFQHMDRCILLHTGRLKEDFQSCMQEIQAKLSAKLVMPNSSLELKSEIQVKGSDMDAFLSDVTEDFQGDERIDRLLCESFIDYHTEHAGLLAELRAAAKLPSFGGESNLPSDAALLKARMLERKSISLILQHITQRYRELERSMAGHQLTILQHGQACEELEQVMRENGNLRSEIAELKVSYDKLVSPPLTGAEERIKKQLSYRLGALLVLKSKKPLGFVTIPYVLLMEYLLFLRERAAQDKDKLPPLHEYEDFYLAEKVKAQLSYRLGNTLVRHIRHPLGWISLPFRLVGQVRAFKRSRNIDK